MRSTTRASILLGDRSLRLYAIAASRYGAQTMWFRLDLRVRADVDDEVLHEIGVLANTYAIVDEVQVTRDAERREPRLTARIDAPSAEAALGALLTVIGQTSGHTGLAEEGSVNRVLIEREEPVL
jgi:hypothetical protein